MRLSEPPTGGRHASSHQRQDEGVNLTFIMPPERPSLNPSLLLPWNLLYGAPRSGADLVALRQEFPLPPVRSRFGKSGRIAEFC